MKVQETAVQSDKIITIPNVLSFLRLLGIPVFVWLIVVEHAYEWAFVLLAVSSFTDYLDGKIARATGQITRLGQLLDPLADRLYIAAAIISFAVVGIIPWWLLVVLLGRDLLMAIVILVLQRRGIIGLPVHFLGKAATFCLLNGFPLLLLGESSGWVGDLARVAGWAFTLWGTGLYWYAAVLYIEQARRILRTTAAP
jgi:cardiolipin synthase (CMP-forming)